MVVGVELGIEVLHEGVWGDAVELLLHPEEFVAAEDHREALEQCVDGAGDAGDLGVYQC